MTELGFVSEFQRLKDMFGYTQNRINEKSEKIAGAVRSILDWVADQCESETISVDFISEIRDLLDVSYSLNGITGYMEEQFEQSRKVVASLEQAHSKNSEQA